MLRRASTAVSTKTTSQRLIDRAQGMGVQIMDLSTLVTELDMMEAKASGKKSSSSSSSSTSRRDPSPGRSLKAPYLKVQDMSG